MYKIKLLLKCVRQYSICACTHAHNIRTQTYTHTGIYKNICGTIAAILVTVSIPCLIVFKSHSRWCTELYCMLVLRFLPAKKHLWTSMYVFLLFDKIGRGWLLRGWGLLHKDLQMCDAISMCIAILFLTVQGIFKITPFFSHYSGCL